MSKLLKEWEAARNDLSLEIVAPYRVDIGPGKTIHAELLVRNFGARHGMLIVTSYALVKPYVEQLVRLGYGFSVLEEPSGEESYDRESLIYMLSDWTWTGRADEKPAWLIDIAEGQDGEQEGD